MKILSHRGANQEFPENTLAAFDRALEIGVDGMETDLLLTQDGQIILHHDDLIRYHGKTYPARELTLSQIREMDLGGGHRIPDLDSFLERYAGKTNLLLEVKAAGVSEVLAEKIKKNSFQNHLHVTSFMASEIGVIKKKIPKIACSLIFTALPFNSRSLFEEAQVREVSLSRNFLTEQTVRDLRGDGILVRIYTVNQFSEAKRFESWGVEAVFTDNPRALQPLRYP